MKQGMSSDDSGRTLNYKTSTNLLGALNGWLGASHHRDIRLALHRAGTMWHLRGQPWESGWGETVVKHWNELKMYTNVGKNASET